MKFNEKLELLMKRKGITNYRLAKEIGCSAASVGYWLSGSKNPTAESIQAIAGYFGVSTDYLMSTDDTNSQEQYEQQEVADMLDEIRKNPELRTMFSITRNATPEQLRQYINVIKAIRGED